jgi:hypothetical protein
MNLRFSAATVFLVWTISVQAEAQEFPVFDLNKGCSQSILGGSVKTVDAQACLTGEQTAKASLAARWSELNAATRARALQDMDASEPKAYTTLQHWIDREQSRTLQ